MMRSSGAVFYSLVYLNWRRSYSRLNYLYPVIPVKIDSRPANTKTSSWTARVRFLASWVDTYVSISVYIHMNTSKNISEHTWIYLCQYRCERSMRWKVEVLQRNSTPRGYTHILYTYLCIHLLMYTLTYVYTYLCIHLLMYTLTYVYTYLCIHLLMYMYREEACVESTYIYTYIHIYLFQYTCIWTYLRIFQNKKTCIYISILMRKIMRLKYIYIYRDLHIYFSIHQYEYI